MNLIEKKVDVLLKAVRWLILRQSTKPDFTRIFDNQAIGQIDELYTEKEIKEDCCDMSEEELNKIPTASDEEAIKIVDKLVDDNPKILKTLEENHSEGCNCGFELEKGKEGCGDVIEELVDTDDNGEIIDTRWLHCGEDKQLCDECKEKKYALEEKSE